MRRLLLIAALLLLALPASSQIGGGPGGPGGGSGPGPGGGISPPGGGGSFPCPDNADFCYHIPTDPLDTICTTGIGYDSITPAGDDASACDSRAYTSSSSESGLVDEADAVTAVGDDIYHLLFHYKYVVELTSVGWAQAVEMRDTGALACGMEINATTNPAGLRVASDLGTTAFTATVAPGAEFDAELTYDGVSGDCSLEIVDVESDTAAGTAAQVVDTVRLSNAQNEAQGEFSHIAACVGGCGVHEATFPATFAFALE